MIKEQADFTIKNELTHIKKPARGREGLGQPEAAAQAGRGMGGNMRSSDNYSMGQRVCQRRVFEF